MNRQEIGRIGQMRSVNAGYGSVFMEEFLRELQGARGIHTYTEMANNDSTIGAIMYAIEMLMRQAEIHIEPQGDTKQDEECAEFIESCLDDMEKTWADTFSEILSFLPYGWSYHEIVYKRRMGRSKNPKTNSKFDDGLIGWQKLPIRAQETLYGWDYKEGTDDLLGMTQQPPPDFDIVTIPLEKALHFRTRSFKDNPEGRSILRTAYRDWYFKKRLQEIEAYGIERDLAGFPVLYSPENIDIWNEDDEEIKAMLARAERLVSSIRRDAREGVVLPGGENGWKLELLASGSRRQFDINATIDRYNKSIATSVLADFVMLGQQQVGSFALADTKTKIFALAIGTYLDIICEVFNNQAIPRLVDLNESHFNGITDYPKMVHGDIEETDLIQFATFLEKVVGIGIIVPDDALEEEVRRRAALPEKVETGVPREPQPGENGQEEDLESKSVYKITNLLEKYRRGNLSRDSTAKLLGSLGLDEEQINFYLKESDGIVATQDAQQEAADGRRSRKKKKQRQTPADDEKDAREAEEARKSLGRMTAPEEGDK